MTRKSEERRPLTATGKIVVATVSFYGIPAAKYDVDSAPISSLTTQVGLKNVHFTVPVRPCNVKYLKFQ